MILIPTSVNGPANSSAALPLFSAATITASVESAVDGSFRSKMTFILASVTVIIAPRSAASVSGFSDVTMMLIVRFLSETAAVTKAVM